MAANLDRNDAESMRQQRQQAMFELIETWQASGQNQQEFCKAHGDGLQRLSLLVQKIS